MSVLIELMVIPPFRSLANTIDSGHLIEYVFDDILFRLPIISPGETTPNNDYPKAKTRSTRGLAFQLLCILCQATPHNFNQLLSLLQSQHETITRPITWDYNPEKLGLSPVGHVGLRNLGSTCYMNSLLQQFYAVSCFLNVVL